MDALMPRGQDDQERRVIGDWQRFWQYDLPVTTHQ